eukprot:Nitzschia sp. Nitz4//scaffold149_size55946//21974//23958//NITZ4_006594-RA/size55946-processed-gene-0.27-mRNA-1//-1//CDS//3329536809//9317//frame0
MNSLSPTSRSEYSPENSMSSSRGFLLLLLLATVSTSDAFWAFVPTRSTGSILSFDSKAMHAARPSSSNTFLRVPRATGQDDDAEEGTSTNLKSAAAPDKASYQLHPRTTPIGFNPTISLNLKHQMKHVPLDVPIPATFVADTSLPTDIGQFRLRAYRTPQSNNEFSGTEPSVIYNPDMPPFGEDGKFKKDVPIRIHDQCFTSEVFRSQRCDCKEQLKMAMEYVNENGGAVIYLQQEGRGIGLANKIAAYSLQDSGMDTVDANLHLGFPEDARVYGAVRSILEDMKIESIQLMTNNPRKVQRLRSLGVDISSTMPMVVPKTNPHNHRYLEAKHQRMAHTNLSPLFSAEMKVKTANQASLNINMDSPDSEEGVVARDDGYCFGRESVEEAIAAVKRGEMIVVVDDMNRENEGDLIMAADACKPEDMATIVRYSSGVICVGMDGERMDQLKLPPMLKNNEDPKGTAFSVTVDATKAHGISTGISAGDRAKTCNLLASPDTTALDFSRPGHIFPLRAREGGVLTRDGHTEAAVDFSVLAGRGAAGILCEIVSEENPTEMARLPELKRFAEQHGYVLTSIVDLAQYRRDTERSS